MIRTLAEVFTPYNFTIRGEPRRSDNGDPYLSSSVLDEVYRHHAALEGIHDPAFNGKDPQHPIQAWIGSGSSVSTYVNLKRAGARIPMRLEHYNVPSIARDWVNDQNSMRGTNYSSMEEYSDHLDTTLAKTKPNPVAGTFYSGLGDEFATHIASHYKPGDPVKLDAHIATSINPYLAGYRGAHVAEFKVPAGVSHLTYIGHHSVFGMEREAILNKSAPLLYTGSSPRKDSMDFGLIHHFLVPG